MTITSAFGTALDDAIHHHLPLNLPAAGDDLRIALQVLHFLADFLVRHLQVLLVLPALQAVVEAAPGSRAPAPTQSTVLSEDVDKKLAELQRRPARRRGASRRAATRSPRPRRALITSTLNSPKPSRTVPVSEKIRFSPLAGLTRLKSGLMPVGQQQEADLQQDSSAPPPSTRKPSIGNTIAARPFMIACQWTIIVPGSAVSVATDSPDRAASGRCENSTICAAHHQQQEAADQQQHRRAEVLAERDLALLAGLLPAMGCRFKCFFAGRLGHGID